MKTRHLLTALALLGSTGLVSAPQPAAADHAQPALNPAVIDYDPIGYYGPPDEAGTPAGESATVPTPAEGPPPLNDPNPSGKWIAYDTDVWESLTIPYRHPGDTCVTLDDHPDCRSGDIDADVTDPVARTGYSGYAGPSGVPSTAHGTCPPHPEVPGPWGQCFNNQLEYLDHYEYSMESSFADLGLIVHRYPFISPGGGTPRGTALAASGGQAYNITATIPGADHPEETVLVGAHYDFTDSGATAAWDSAEGHTEIMRMAYIMAKYYRDTGTRPSATLKFVPWDSEESGTHGSQDYVSNNIPPDEFDEVRGYFNVDPCAGAYPAYEDGTNTRVPEVLQLANPANWEAYPEIKARIEAFNAKTPQIVEQVFDYMDDSITRPGGAEEPIFVSNAEATAGNDGTQPVTDSHRDEVITAVGGLALFGSDYMNFEEVGIPIFNLFPDYFGPHADIETNPEGSARASTKGISILHTNNDNLTRLNRLTTGLTDPGELTDPTGTFASEGWAKGMEMCAQVEAWGMLQPEMAGTQTANTTPVAYYEALPNEALVNQNVTFDGTGTYQYSNPMTRTMQPDGALSYLWDFGDGTTGSGKTVQHSYAELGRYNSKLTVTGAGGLQDTMEIPVKVIGSNFIGPVLGAITPQDAEDGNFALSWDFAGTRAGFQHFDVEESFDFQTLFTDDAETIDTNWVVTSAGNPEIHDWQPSDSATAKFRGNQAHSGVRSFWAGQSPPFPAPPTVVSGRTYLTLKNPIAVPSTGDPEVQYWSIFQNEGDDQGRVEVARTVPGTPADQLEWQPVDIVQSAGGSVGGPFDPHVCDTTNPDQSLAVGFESRRADLTAYKGQDILIRFNYTLGAENRIPSQPCGWYVDDPRVYTGNWEEIGTTTTEEFVVTDRPNLTWAYRVKGVYNDGVATAASNVEIADVTKSRNIPKQDLLRCLRTKGQHILGSVGKDKLIGTEGPDVICGFAGKDRISALGGDDIVFGFKGNDHESGGRGNDRLLGDQGNDRLSGGKGKDRLKGGKGKDLLNGGGGNDSCTKSDRSKSC